MSSKTQPPHKDPQRMARLAEELHGRNVICDDGLKHERAKANRPQPRS